MLPFCNLSGKPAAPLLEEPALFSRAGGRHEGLMGIDRDGDVYTSLKAIRGLKFRLRDENAYGGGLGGEAWLQLAVDRPLKRIAANIHK